jgi:hypothetical protein
VAKKEAAGYGTWKSVRELGSAGSWENGEVRGCQAAFRSDRLLLNVIWFALRILVFLAHVAVDFLGWKREVPRKESFV